MNVQLGLKENWRQFTLLVIINGFVGGMVGLERSILPQLAEQEFGLAAKSSILSFIVVFGMVKAITNYYAGILSNDWGRKRVLLLGWFVAIPIPFILMFATSWSWVIAANVLLGVNQGLAWSSTVLMKIDLVGEKQRGLAMGLNEFAGYIAVAIIAFVTGWIGSEYGLRPYPFYVGIGLVMVGLTASLFFIQDTGHHVKEEAASSATKRLQQIFWETTWKHHNLGSVTQAGLVNNLNDGMMWGIFPLMLTARGFTLHQVGIIVAVYPAVWGIGQLFTGRLADVICKRDLLFVGMLVQAVALIFFIWADTITELVTLAAVLGLGTALVYPTFLAAVAENTHPIDRATSIGIFRLWRDSGYAFGAFLTGLLADLMSMEISILCIGAITFLSSLIILYRMKCDEVNVKSFKLLC